MTAPHVRDGLMAVRRAVLDVRHDDDLTLEAVARSLVASELALGAAVVDDTTGRCRGAAGSHVALMAHSARLVESGTTLLAPDVRTLSLPVPVENSAPLTLIIDVASNAADKAIPDVVLEGVACYLGMQLDLADARTRTAAAEHMAMTLSRASQVLGETLNSTEVLSKILDQLRLVVPYDSASVQLLQGDNTVRVIGTSGFANPDEVIGLTFSLAGHNPNNAIINSGKSHILAEAATIYPGFGRGPHREAVVRGWLGVPLQFHGEVIGMISIDSQTPNFFNEDHMRSAEAFAAQAAVAISNARLFGEMERLASHDPLTGLPNRRHLEEASKPVVEAAATQHRPLAVLMIDLDHFKQINDEHGHTVGDSVLKIVAKRIQSVLRPDDLVARIGGEEFVIMLPGADVASALAVGERVRQTVSRSSVATDSGALDVTTSVGAFVCTDLAETGGASLKELLQLADKALYQAKSEGRNCTVVDATVATNR